MKLKVSGIVDDSIVDGEGLRLTIFCQGCNKNPHCEGCHNKQTWDKNGGVWMDTSEIITIIKENKLLSGVTFSGGEPFDQPEPLIELAKKVHELQLNVWAFSGWTLEELYAFKNESIKELINNIDVLVEGRFVNELKDLSLTFRGSSNQNILDIKKTISSGKKVKYME